jgi:hypothetical protein
MGDKTLPRGDRSGGRFARRGSAPREPHGIGGVWQRKSSSGPSQIRRSPEDAPCSPLDAGSPMKAYELFVNDPQWPRGLMLCEAAIRKTARASANRLRTWLKLLFAVDAELLETLSREQLCRLQTEATSRGDKGLAARCRMAMDDPLVRRELAAAWLPVLRRAETWAAVPWVRRGGGARETVTPRSGPCLLVGALRGRRRWPPLPPWIPAQTRVGARARLARCAGRRTARSTQTRLI